VQVAYYKAILEKIGKKPTVFRLMDLGGDKTPDFFNMPSEFNPFMGWRAIRIFLERKDLFESQLSSIMQAGRRHTYSIMIPMVTTLAEWLEAKAFIRQIADKLGMRMPMCGVLLEVPLAILEIDNFLKEADFASIGTNDLIQYLSAADRNNAKVNYLYDPVEPAFLKIIRNAIKTSNDQGKPLSICGEMAGNPLHAVTLLGLGLRRFSVVPRNIPILKELISRTSFAEASESVTHIESIRTTEGMHEWMKNLNSRIVGDILEHLPMTADV
jgi:phosphoenolpyruvate-protein kinase (PTS system EI component)